MNETLKEQTDQVKAGRILRDISIPGESENLKPCGELKFLEKCISYVRKWWGFGTILLFVFASLSFVFASVYYLLAIWLMVARLLDLYKP